MMGRWRRGGGGGGCPTIHLSLFGKVIQNKINHHHPVLLVLQRDENKNPPLYRMGWLYGGGGGMGAKCTVLPISQKFKFFYFLSLIFHWFILVVIIMERKIFVHKMIWLRWWWWRHHVQKKVVVTYMNWFYGTR